ncbi:hypothetical protein GCM10017772_34490 [Promicromonospora soli]|uniref:Uncharacterized protein n=1 Tax=Promicromonospora soli TaxID=2035533 RepID=A0A919G346_9MICO|nr:hypothetical protein GCM10017772_34490 [Promicromonospora soli]
MLDAALQRSDDVRASGSRTQCEVRNQSRGRQAAPRVSWAGRSSIPGRARSSVYDSILRKVEDIATQPPGF